MFIEQMKREAEEWHINQAIKVREQNKKIQANNEVDGFIVI